MLLVHYLPLNEHLMAALFIVYLWRTPCSLFTLMAALSVVKQFWPERDKIFAFTFSFAANYKVASKLSKNWWNILKGYGQRCLVTDYSSPWHLFKQRTNAIYAEAMQILISQLQWYDPALYWPWRKENLQKFFKPVYSYKLRFNKTIIHYNLLVLVKSPQII